MKIFENYTYTLINGRNNYFKDLNICFTKYYDAIYITDLENALKTGKECKEYIIKIEKNKYMPYSKKFILDLKNGKYDNSVSIRTHKSIKIFTPFVKIKPIKIPTKWKISNIWKAILSGQITKITKKYRTTDDFAYDNSVNFEKGKKIDNLKFAMELIEASSGWWCRVDEENKETIKLIVCCHTFDSNIAIFNK
jgi:hypothetical protein